MIWLHDITRFFGIIIFRARRIIMAKEVSTRARYLAMILGGIIALFLIPRDPWPIGYFIYLYFCSIVGSSAGHLIVKENFKKFLLQSA